MVEVPAEYRVGRDETVAFMRTLSRWNAWGPDDQRGALNFITPEKRRRAAALVRDGAALSASRPLPTEPAADNPRPVTHEMIQTGLDREALSSSDSFAVAPHGYATTHLDALCHVFYKQSMYNGRPREAVGDTGASRNAIDAVRDGIVTRGVLLDLPRLKARPWLEPGEPIFPGDLEAAERAAGLRVETGDFLLIRTGRWRYRDEHGAWDASTLLAGLHASCLPWLHAREIAALGCDGVSDCLPSLVERVRLPIHLVGIVAMGLHLLDNADLDRLDEECARRKRWEFLFTVAPLVLERGTGSPVNPIAVF